jgi:hypothetical protein
MRDMRGLDNPSGQNLTFESRGGFRIASSHASLVHAHWNFSHGLAVGTSAPSGSG